MLEVALIGRPNAGKTTIFNGLTGLNEKTGNWHGVTVQGKKAKIKNSDITLCDLPGAYSLTAFSPEEKATEKYALENPDALFLSVVSAADFIQGVKTTLALISRGVKTALALTFFDEFKKQGGKIKLSVIEKILKIPVIAINANDAADIKKLKKFTENALKHTYAHTFNLSQAAIADLEKAYVPPKYKSNFLDKLLLNKYLCPLCFLCVTLFVFYATFGKYSIGVFLQNLISAFMQNCADKLRLALYQSGCSQALVGFVTQGVLGGALSALSFVPQLAVMYLFLTVLEESGFMARIAFMFDGVFSKIGLNGRAAFSIFMGFGCTAVAELSTKALDDKSLQKKTALALPFISCSAKLPVYLVLINAFFVKNKVLVLFFIYVTGVLLAAITAAALDKFIYKNSQTFIMELPPLRFVGIKKLSKTLLYYLKQFIIRVGSVITAVVVALWFLKSYSPALKFVGNAVGESLLGHIGKALKYLFYPMGVTDWRLSVSALSGIFAKEAIVGTLELLCPDGVRSILTPAQALSFLCFCATYTPCLSALATIKRTIGFKYALLCGVGTFLFALTFGYVAYFLALVVQLAAINPVLIIFAAMVVVCVFFVKIALKNKCDGCNRCSGGDYEGNCKYKKRKTN